ncbi:MAG: YwmB family TATA-box binding protein [Herbinix sp.]|nr:YwmB family TATA-box binding protein [Herbinix sp.]
MGNSRWDDITDRLKHTFSMKRTRITMYIAAVLWVAVATQMVMNRVFKEEIQITEAFIKSDTEEMKSSLELVAEYKTGTLSEDSKKDIIYNLSDAIGLMIDDDITVQEETGRSELSFYKQAKKATTEIKVVSMEQEVDAAVEIKHYIIVRLSILDGIQSIDKYKKLLENDLDELGVQSKQVILKFEGNREGNLTTLQKQEIAKLLVNELQGEIALEYDEGDLYTVYAYTGMLNEYITSLGNKINIQIAITYNELTNKTKITLATPILNESW